MKSNQSKDSNQFLKLVEKYGSPLYVYEGEVIVRQILKLRSAFSGFNPRILYAAKALNNPAILKLIRQQGCGIDAVSPFEIELALMAGFEPESILFSPSNPQFFDLEAARKIGVHVNIESLQHLKTWGRVVRSAYPVFIRINPHIQAGGNIKIQTGHIDSKFGISIFQLPEILEVVQKFGIDVEGLHVHTGSEFLDSDVFLQGARLLFDAAREFPKLKFLDFGSGFKVSNKPGDLETPVADLGEKLGRLIHDASEKREPIEIWFEPGKYLVMEAGTLLTTVTTIKPTPTSLFVGVDTGLNHLLRPMMYDAYHTIENLSSQAENSHVYSIVGNICETDTLGYNRLLPDTVEGDILAIRNSGAYGYSMASQYNARPRPAEVLIWKGKDYLIRRREELSDLISTIVEIPGQFWNENQTD